MKFQDFCNKMASPIPLSKEQSYEVCPPERYKKATDTMISMMKNRKDAFDRIDVPPYINMIFDQDYISILEDKLEDGDVPTGIIFHLSKGIYDLNPSELDDKQQAIIKVLSTYICIQN